MAIRNGTLTLLTAGGIAITHTTSATMDLGDEQPDAMSKDSGGWDDWIFGKRTLSFGVNGLVDYSASYGIAELRALITGRATVVAVFAGIVTGNLRVTVTVGLSSLTEDSPAEGPETFSGTLRSKGIPVFDTVP